MKKITSLLLSVVIIASMITVLSGCTSSTAEKSVSTNYKLSSNVENGAILHCFCWDFDTITNSLEDIAAAGYSSIQTSPINECLVGESGGMQLYGNGKWYYHFQPTDYTIGNYQLGTRDQFKKMCAKAKKLGIKVLVDVVANHTTTTTGSINKNLYNAVGGEDKLFHKNSQFDINDYGDRLQCTTYKMGGLPDINTENKKFQNYFINYLNDCISCGASGFRYDAAKHIALPDDPTETKGVKNNFWTRVTTEIKNSKNIFNYGEVLQGSNDRIADYIKKIGHTTASSYGEAVRNAVMQEDIDTAFVSDLKVGSDESCVTWVESHDNYINDGNWSAMNEQQVILAWSIICSRSVGTPLFYDRPYGSSTEDQWGMNRIGASGSYMYKNDTVKAVNFFHNAMIGEDENMYNLDEDCGSLEICRGDKGAVIINMADNLKVNGDTDLADGTYIDRVDNKTEYTVKDGKITCDKPLKKNTVVVLYNKGYTEYAKSATVKVSDKAQFSYSDKTQKVTLQCSNAKKATYQLNDGKVTTYKNGDTITIKASEGTDGVNTLTLKGTSNAGKTTYMKYYFTNDSVTGNSSATKVSKGDVVYFQKPASWGKKMYAYVYNNDDQHNAEWPGLPMTKVKGNKYKFKFKYDWENSMIIFTDGTNQYPGQNEAGLSIVKDKTYATE